MTAINGTRSVKRRRSTKAEVEQFRTALYAICEATRPLSVRQAYYRALVAGILPEKGKKGEGMVQRNLSIMRDDGTVPFEWIVDESRSVYRTSTFDSIEDALRQTAELYRRDLWSGHEDRLEVWCESRAIAGTIAGVCREWAVDLFPTGGFSSKSFTYWAAQAANRDGRPLRIIYIGDHDPAGLEIEQSSRRQLNQHCHVPISWERIGVTWEQVETMNLPGTTPKKAYGFPLAVEAEALPPNTLRDLVSDAISFEADHDRLEVLLAAEESERGILRSMKGGAA